MLAPELLVRLPALCLSVQVDSLSLQPSDTEASFHEFGLRMAQALSCLVPFATRLQEFPVRAHPAPEGDCESTYEKGDDHGAKHRHAPAYRPSKPDRLAPCSLRTPQPHL